MLLLKSSSEIWRERTAGAVSKCSFCLEARKEHSRKILRSQKGAISCQHVKSYEEFRNVSKVRLKIKQKANLSWTE